MTAKANYCQGNNAGQNERNGMKSQLAEKI